MTDTFDTDRKPAWRTLRPGDPWTFIEREPIRMGLSGPAAGAGALIAWMPDDAPAEIELLFRVERVHEPHTYECVHVAQPPAYQDRSHLDADGQPRLFRRRSPQ